MKLIIILSIIAVTCNAFPHLSKIDAELDIHWETYKSKFNKQYHQQDEYMRRLIWETNLKYIQKHNLEFDMGKHSYSLGLNDFADLTHAEFKAYYLSSKRPSNRTQGSYYMTPMNRGNAPDSVDWRTQGYVTDVKDQGQCGSCWSFSTTGSLEGQYFHKTGQLKSFSEQQLVDCSRQYGNYGCSGGWMDYAFTYIKDYGIELESQYPYTAQDGICKYDATQVITKVTGFVDVPTGDENGLKDAVGTVGPVSIAIDASQSSFQFYKSGVYDEPNCSSTQLDHGVLAVGYGSETNQDFWIVKNSWGPSWGSAGYIKMSRGKNNQCGVATAASYPLL